MSFALTFSWRRFVLAIGDRDCANKNESAVFAFGVPAKNFAHQMPAHFSLKIGAAITVSAVGVDGLISSVTGGTADDFLSR
jgi:hypothetical protein